MKVLSVFKYYDDNKVGFDTYTVEEPINEYQKQALKITYNECHVDGDMHYCDVYLADLKKIRIFSPDEIVFQMGESK